MVTEATLRVSVQNVSKHFGRTMALRDVSLELHAGTIHGVVGRNGAGKSTLVGIISGDLRPDAGQVVMHEAAALTRPSHSHHSRTPPQIGVVYQQIKLVHHLTVAENLLLGVYNPRWARRSDFRRRAQSILDEWHLPLNPDTTVRDLRLDEQQLISVARALAGGATVILLDEPTARLNWRETEALCERIIAFARRKVAFLFISHSLKEVLDLCHELTILRDGQCVASGPVGAFDEADLVYRMTGLTAENRRRAVKRKRQIKDAAGAPEIFRPALRARNVVIPRLVEGVDVDLAEGQWLGITGLVGSGAIPLAEALAGFRPFQSGSVTIHGRALVSGRRSHAQRLGVAFVPPDRHMNGLVPPMSIQQNISLASLRVLSQWGIVNGRAEARLAHDQVEAFQIVATDLDQPATALSGGNQQKALLAREVSTRLPLIIFTNSTIGVDIASKEAIYIWMEKLRELGRTGIVATEDELSDLEICDRVIVLVEGRIVRDFGASREPEQLLAAIEGFEPAANPTVPN